MAHEDPTADIDDIDFCLELLHSDVINVAYILELIEDLNPASDDYQMKRQNIIDTMIKAPAMRNKAKLIDHFIRDNVDNDQAGFGESSDNLCYSGTSPCGYFIGYGSGSKS